MTSVPLVTVVIPCFNQARYLAGALSSVHTQDWPALESIVIDDGSTDGTSHAATRLGATIVARQENQGLSAARNAGLARASGEFVVFLDADDELVQGSVRANVETLLRNPNAHCVAGLCRIIDFEGKPVPTTPPQCNTTDIYRELLGINIVWTPGAAMFRTGAIRGIGGFPVETPAAADYAVMLAFARRGWMLFERREVVRYRKHDSNMSHDPILMLQSTLSVLARERPHVGARYRDALVAGRRRWRAFYGERLSVQLRREWRGARRPLALARGAFFFCRHCPRDAAAHVWRKLNCVIRKRPPSDIDPHGHEPVQPLLLQKAWRNRNGAS